MVWYAKTFIVKPCSCILLYIYYLTVKLTSNKLVASSLNAKKNIMNTISIKKTLFKPISTYKSCENIDFFNCIFKQTDQPNQYKPNKIDYFSSVSFLKNSQNRTDEDFIGSNIFWSKIDPNRTVTPLTGIELHSFEGVHLHTLEFWKSHLPYYWKSHFHMLNI